MAYDPQVYEAVSERFRQLRAQARQQLEERRREVFAKIPRIKDIAAELTAVKTRMIQAIFDGESTAELAEECRRLSLSLQAERAELLYASGYPVDYLDYKPQCPVCGDEGTVGTRNCECYERELRLEQFARSNLGGKLGHQVFDDFELSFYPAQKGEDGISPRDIMKRVLDNCKNYAAGFSRESPNLLFIGSPGLGKTFMSSCIANEVISRGFSVIYDSTQNVLMRFENVRFGREDLSAVQKYFDCDLLIMDDLGAEFLTPVSESALYNVINTRITSARPLILSTNLTPRQIASSYNDRISSRLDGEFVILHFAGEDLRRKAMAKKRRK